MSYPVFKGWKACHHHASSNDRWWIAMNKMFEIIDGLFTSGYKDASNLLLLMHHHVGTIVNCTSNVDNFFEKNNNFKYLRVPLTEWSEITPKMLDETTAFIDEHLSRHDHDIHNVLVHCAAGYQRSPTIVIGYLTRYKGFSLQDAVQLIDEKLSGNYYPTIELLGSVAQQVDPAGTFDPKAFIDARETAWQARILDECGQDVLDTYLEKKSQLI